MLGLAAALYPQLLAVVVVILTRPNPKPLLWACYLGSLVVSVGCSAAILAVFRSRGSVAGTSSHSLGPATYMVVGGIALVLATFAATQRGRELLARDLSRARWRKQDKQDASGSVQRVRSKDSHQTRLRKGLVRMERSGWWTSREQLECRAPWRRSGRRQCLRQKAQRWR